jgi:type IX secretion system PorP/SprF family membrane protein
MKKVLRLSLLFAAFVCTAHIAHGQDAPIFSQFLQNPFQFNPSYAANNGYAEINAFYRKQWLGVENAPTVGAFNIQNPIGRNVSVGLTLVTNKTILLNTNSAVATFAYRVRLGAYHHLNFGLASGIAFNNFDLEAVANTNDPALLNAVQKSQYMVGQFGFNYQFKNFHIGLALPNLLDSKPNSLKEFQQIDFDPFRNKFGSIGYSFNLSEIQLSPVVIYRALDNKQTQWEGMVVATYRGFLWAGVSYREGYGLTGLIGVRLKNQYKLGYAYEHPTSSLRNAANGSHEIYFGMRIGKRDREDEFVLEQKTADSLKQIAAAQKKLEDELKAKKEQELAAKKPQPEVEKTPIKTEVQPENKPVIVVADSTPVQKPQPIVRAEEIKPVAQPDSANIAPEKADYFVVLGAYRSQENALKQMRELRERGQLPQMMYVLDKNIYYVYLHKTEDRAAALEELTKEKNRGRYQGVWLYKVPKK